MKKILLAFILTLFGLGAYAQTEFMDLPEVTTTISADWNAMLRSGAGVRISLPNLFAPTDDSIAAHLGRIESLEADVLANASDISDNTDSLFLTRSGTNLSPKTAGDDILLRASSELLKWSDGDTYIQEVVDDILYFYVGGDFRWTLSTSNFNLYVPITPSPDKAIDFGGVGDFFKDAYFNRWYVANTSTYIDTTGNNLRFTDATTGTKTLAELAAGEYWTRTGTNLSPTTSGDGVLIPSDDSLLFGDRSAWLLEAGPGNTIEIGADGVQVARISGAEFQIYNDIEIDQGFALRSDDTNTEIWEDGSGNWTFKDAVAGTHTLAALASGAAGDTVTLGELAPIHSDTIPEFVFGYGTGRSTDTLDCWDGAEIGAFLTGPTDSTSCVSFTGVVTAGLGTPTVTVQFFYDVNLDDGTPTAITAATAFTSTTSGTVISSFTNQTIPPNVWVWGEITTVSIGNKPVKLRITMHRYKRNGE